MRIRTVCAVLAMLASAAPVRGAYVTPPNKTVVDFQPAKYQLGDSFWRARIEVTRNGYDPPVQLWQTAPSYSPTIGFDDFTNFFSNDFGIVLYAGHGIQESPGISWQEVEQYPYNDTGLTAAWTAAETYISNGEVGVNDIMVWADENDPPAAWIVTLSNAGIAQHRNTTSADQAFVYNATCYSNDFASAWNVKTYQGYSSRVGNAVAIAQADTFFTAMDGGKYGPGLRSAGGATYITNTCSSFLGQPQIGHTGELGMVLAPAIAGYTYGSNTEDGTITFDTEMDYTIGASGLMHASGSISLGSADWVSPTEIVYSVYCTTDGSGRVSLITSMITSASGIKLNPDGTGTNGEPYSIGYTCNGGVNPAANVENPVAMQDASGVTFRWTTSWERGTDSFQAVRLGSEGTRTPLPVVPAHGPGPYEVLDPAGSATDQYQLVEHQTNGPDLSYGYHAVLPSFTPDNTDFAYDLGAIQTVLATVPQSDLRTETEPTFQVGIVIPDSMVTTAWLYVDILMYYRHVTAYPIRLSETATWGGIQQTLAHYHAVGGMNSVVFVGIASDSSLVLHQSEPGYPGQPNPPLYAANILSTNYVFDPADSTQHSTFYWTRWAMTDARYVDFDGDELPDIPYARIPAKNNVEFQAYLAKFSTYHTTSPVVPWTRRALVISWAIDNGNVPGPVVGAHAESLAVSIPAYYTVQKYIDVEGPSGPVWTTTQMFTFFRNEMNAGIAFADVSSTITNQIHYGVDGVPWGWSPNVWTPNNAFPIFIVANCGSGNIDGTRYAIYGDPIAERMLMLSNRGPIAIFGASRGTLEYGNAIYKRLLVDYIFRLHYNLGTAHLLAVRTMMAQYPEYRLQAQTFHLLGDPNLTPIGFPISLTAAEPTPPVLRTRLGAPAPNPFNPSTALTVHVAAPTRVQLRVYDIAGRVVRTLADRSFQAGSTMLRWNGTTDDGRPVASGVYFARLTAPAVDERQKLVLLK